MKISEDIDPISFMQGLGQANVDVPPISFMQGLGQGSYDYSYAPQMLGNLGQSEQDAIVFMSGLGQGPFINQPRPGTKAPPLPTPPQVAPKPPPGVPANAPVIPVSATLDKIQVMMRMLDERIAALEKATQRAVPPQANEARAVMMAMKLAAEAAAVAKRERERTAILLQQRDKAGAAASAVRYLQALRKAVILATKAEKTRVARGLDNYAKLFSTQAEFLDGAVKTQERAAGMMVGNEGIKVLVGKLNALVKQMKDTSAAIAAMSDDASVVELSDKRIAEVANKFNIRTTMQARGEDQRALVSVLSDAMDSALAQAPDYGGAVQYYGGDLVGRLMADIEFNNNVGVIGALNRFEQLMGAKGVNTPLANGAALLLEAPRTAQEAKAAADSVALKTGQRPPMSRLAGLAAAGCAACTGRINGLGGLAGAETDTSKIPGKGQCDKAFYKAEKAAGRAGWSGYCSCMFPEGPAREACFDTARGRTCSNGFCTGRACNSQICLGAKDPMTCDGKLDMLIYSKGAANPFENNEELFFCARKLGQGVIDALKLININVPGEATGSSQQQQQAQADAMAESRAQIMRMKDSELRAFIAANPAGVPNDIAVNEQAWRRANAPCPRIGRTAQVREGTTLDSSGRPACVPGAGSGFTPPNIGVRPLPGFTPPNLNIPGLTGEKQEETKKDTTTGAAKKDSTTMYLALGGVAVVAAYFLFGRKGPALNPVP